MMMMIYKEENEFIRINYRNISLASLQRFVASEYENNAVKGEILHASAEEDEQFRSGFPAIYNGSDRLIQIDHSGTMIWREDDAVNKMDDHELQSFVPNSERLID